MKIVITASGPTVDAQVDPRFARAPWFAVFDTDSGEVEFKDNSQNMQAAHGAGIEIVTGAEGTVQEACQKFLEDRANR